MDREKLDTGCERGILGLALAILVYAPLMLGAVRPGDFLVLQGLTLGVLGLWGARLWLDPRPKLLWPPICWAVLAFVIYTVVRYFTADLEYVARQEMIRVLVYAILFFAIVNNLHRQETTQTIAFTMIFLAMLIGGYAVIQFITKSQKVLWFTTPYSYRGTGTFISPNNLAGFLEMVIPLGLAYTLTARGKPVTKVLLGYASLVMLVGLAMSVSRGGWVATTAALLFLFVVLAFRRSYRLPALGFLLLIVVAGIYFIPRNAVFQARLEETSKDLPKEDYSRFDIWRGAMNMWRTDKLWGVGPAHFDYRFREFRPQAVQGRPVWAHNDYVNTLADYGVVGLALVASVLTLLAWGVFKTWRFVLRSESDLGRKRSNKFAFVLGASVALIAISIHSFVDFNMHIPANAILAITLMALLSSHLRFATERFWFTTRPWLKLVVSVMFLGGFVYLSAQEIRHVREEVWLRRAARQIEASPEQIESLKKAFAIEPLNFETAYQIGEAYRLQAWIGSGDYESVAEQGMDWFKRVMALNPFDPYGWLRYGMCLDWIRQHEKAWPYYQKAMGLDPNGYFTVDWVAWHYVQIGNYAAAKMIFERSLRLNWQENTMADTYIPVLNQKMIEAATNTSLFRLPPPL